MVHIPVLLKESMDLLKSEKGKMFIDATINGGGHSREILKRMKRRVVLIGIEQDGDLINSLKNKFQKEIGEKRLILKKGNFRNLKNLLKEIDPSAKLRVNGIIFDLGMSSYHLEKSGRGFSFQKDEPLIMTYSAEFQDKLTAREILNQWSREELEEILREYGEERYARKISQAIAEKRKKKKFKTTKDLVDVFLKPAPRIKKIHPATKTFQALRIAVNDELNSLKDGLEQGFEILNKGGRMVVISFHSLEDRIVKNFFRQKNQENQGQILTKKPIQPSIEEIRQNPRSRSAKLRAIIKN